MCNNASGDGESRARRATGRRDFLRQIGRGSLAAALAWVSRPGSGRAASSAAATPEKYQLSCQTLPYRAHPLQRALEGIRKAGYTYVMLYQSHAGQPVFTPTLSAAERSALKRLLEDHGLTVHMSFVGLSVDIKTEKGRSDYKRELDLFREFEIRTVIGVGPWYYKRFPDEPRPPQEWQQECDLFYKGLEMVVPHAEKLGITITLKPHTGITATAKACLEVVGRIVSERLKICWDAGNVSYYEGIHPDPDLPQLAPHVRAVCIKDHRGGRAHHDFPVPGQGDVDHERMFRTLFGAGFRGPLSLERVDGTMDAMKMEPELIDRRIGDAYTFLRPLLDRCSVG